jgi:hypothetical protein
VQHVYLIRDRKALTSPAVGAWWNYVEQISAQGVPDETPPSEHDAAQAAGQPLGEADGTRNHRGRDAVAKKQAALPTG